MSPPNTHHLSWCLAAQVLFQLTSIWIKSPQEILLNFLMNLMRRFINSNKRRIDIMVTAKRNIIAAQEKSILTLNMQTLIFLLWASKCYWKIFVVRNVRVESLQWGILDHTRSLVPQRKVSTSFSILSLEKLHCKKKSVQCTPNMVCYVCPVWNTLYGVK